MTEETDIDRDREARVFDPAAPGYSRISLFERLSQDNLARLHEKRIALVGVGGLGSGFLASAGRLPFAQLRLIDRDLVEPENLGHQLIFTLEDAERHRSKVEAAERHLREINDTTIFTPQLVDLVHGNAEQMLKGADLIVDGLDNFHTRFLINDYAVKHSIPWIYSGVVEDEVAAMAVIPGETPCLRCWKREPPEVGETRTCDVYGVSPAAVTMAGSLMAELAVQILLDETGNAGRLYNFDFTSFSMNSMALERDPDCPCCSRGEYQFLSGELAPSEGHICGSDAAQIRLGSDRLELTGVAERVEDYETTLGSSFLVVNTGNGRRVTIFRDGRVLQTGSSDLSELRGFVDKYIGT